MIIYHWLNLDWNQPSSYQNFELRSFSFKLRSTLCTNFLSIDSKKIPISSISSLTLLLKGDWKEDTVDWWQKISALKYLRFNEISVELANWFWTFLIVWCNIQYFKYKYFILSKFFIPKASRTPFKKPGRRLLEFSLEDVHNSNGILLGHI